MQKSKRGFFLRIQCQNEYFKSYLFYDTERTYGRGSQLEAHNNNYPNTL